MGGGLHVGFCFCAMWAWRMAKDCSLTPREEGLVQRREKRLPTLGPTLPTRKQYLIRRPLRRACVQETVAQTGSHYLGGANWPLHWHNKPRPRPGVCCCQLGYALPPSTLPVRPCDDLSITPRGSSHRGREDKKEEEEELKRYQEFQKRQVQILLELREAQADAEAERRLEHLRQVGCGLRGLGMWW